MNDRWSLNPKGRYFVTRNDSSIVAFKNPGAYARGLKLVGAHTDSPCLKIKPNPELNSQGYWQLGVEVYGGVLLHPWFDRDLSIAGRVSGILESGEAFNQLIDFKDPVAIIPSLAIHLDREANNASTVNAQKHLPIILGRRNTEHDGSSFNSLLLAYCRKDAAQVLDFELSCYDTQAPSIIGIDKEFIAAARLDNLLSSYIGTRAFLDAQTPDDQCVLFVSTDHEEVGSASTSGAQGPFLKSVLERICPDPQSLSQCISQSMLISCDNAHGVHPNFADKHDQNHGPILNGGPVIKINTNQRYATNSISSAAYQRVCASAGVPFQQFVVRSDMACGSTIGPIMAAELGIDTIDVGAPQWAMHSIRETAGTLDCEYLRTSLETFLS